MSGPAFAPGLHLPLTHPLTGRAYTLLRSDLLEDTPETVAQLVAACNEPHIYHWLFAERLAGAPYSALQAATFFARRQADWQAGQTFSFVLLDEMQQIAGTLDIQSPDLAGAEVGYWLRRAHRGLMASALGVLAEVAGQAGYRQLHADVRLGNVASARVLARAGWQVAGEVITENRVFLRFVLALPATLPP